MLKIRVAVMFPSQLFSKETSKPKMDIYLSLSGSKEAVLLGIILLKVSKAFLIAPASAVKISLLGAKARKSFSV